MFTRTSTHRAARALASAAVVSLAFALTACASAGSSGDSPSAEGSWGSAQAQQPSLMLMADGTLSGTDGCNNLAGSWEQDGATVEFGQVASTLMACEGVDTWLSGLATATIDGDTLHILDAAGAELGTLDRS